MKKLKKNKVDFTKFHKEKLGMDIPEGFFAKSKEDILNLTETKNKPKVIWLRPFIAYPVAAVLIIALAITFWMKNDSQSFKDTVVDTEEIESSISEFYEDDYLLSSLLVKDSEMEEFLDDYIIDEIIIEVDKKEQELDDLIINSLFVEDSLIDNFMEKNLIENIIL